MKLKFISFFLILFLVVLGFSSVKTKAAVIENEIIYNGETTIYKDSKSVLLLSTIFELTKNNFVSTSTYTVVVSDDQYTYHGATVGSYVVELTATTSNDVECVQVINVVVLNDLACDYVYNKTFYLKTSSFLTKSTLLDTCKKVGLAPNVALQASITSDYFLNDNQKVAGFYPLSINYLSATGASGNISGRIITEESVVYDLYDVTEENNNDKIINIILVVSGVAASGLLALLCYQTFRTKKRKFY